MVFEEVIPYRPYIHQLVFNWCHNHSDSDDIEQEILIKLYHKISTFQSRAAFTSWLYRLAHNVMCSYFRENPNQSMKYDFDFNMLQSNHYNRAEHLAERRLLKEIFLFIRSLPKTDQKIFRCVFLKGLRPKEVADLLEESPRYVNVRMNRIRNKIRTKFKREQKYL